jgi:hypothetical protein
VFLQVRVIAVDARVENGDVGARTGVAVVVCDVGVDAVDAPREGFTERLGLRVVLDVLDGGRLR